jgi:hypothetical protein
MVQGKSYPITPFPDLLRRMAELNPERLTVRLPGELKQSLLEIAHAQRPPVEPAELLRRAGVAIERCWNEHGMVPADMEIRQRRMTVLLDESHPSERFGVNETGAHPAPQAAATAALRQLRKAEREPEGKRPAAHK